VHQRHPRWTKVPAREERIADAVDLHFGERIKMPCGVMVFMRGSPTYSSRYCRERNVGRATFGTANANENCW
jgi:hypothetical protein